MIDSAGYSEIGRKRKNNEDRYYLDPRSNFFLVLDGMGGHAAGEIAADLSLRAISEFVELARRPGELTWPFGYDVNLSYEHNVLRTAFDLANLKINQACQEMEHYSGMGATAVAAWIKPEGLFFTHVGDSRIYLLREGRLRRLTEDHTLVQEQINRGIISPEDAAEHALRHVVTRALGMRSRMEIDVHRETLGAGDHLLLCSDGVSDSLPDDRIREVLLGDGHAAALCEELVKAADQAGGRDNITAILVQVR